MPPVQHIVPTDQERARERFQAYADRFGTEEPAGPQASWSSGFAASFESAVEDAPAMSFLRGAELTAAGHGVGKYGRWTGPTPRPIPKQDISADQVSGIAKAAGLDVDFGTGSYSQAAVQIMLDRARERRDREDVMRSAETGLGTHLAAGLLAGVIDPISVTTAFMPVAPARLGLAAEQAATAAGRAGYRAVRGVVEGAAGAAAVEPLTYIAATQEGRGYGAMQSVINIGLGAALGAGLHVAAGVVRDIPEISGTEFSPGLQGRWDARIRGMKSFDPPSATDVHLRLDDGVTMEAWQRSVEDLLLGEPVSASQVIHKAASASPDLARRVLVSSALKRDGPDLDAIVERQEWWVERLRTAAIRRKGDDATKAEVEYTRRMMTEAGVKPKSNHAHAARKIVEYERNVFAAERVTADLQAERSFLDEMLDDFDESQLSPDELANLTADREAIAVSLKKETDDIDAYMACLFGE